MSRRFQQYQTLMYPSLLMCTILAACASQSSNTHKESEPAAAEHIAKLEDKIIDLETRLTALNDKINLEEAEKPAASAKPANAKPVEASLPTEKVQPAAAAKNAVIPRSSKPQSKFAESFQQDDATDRYREAKIIYDSGKFADAILEFSDFVKDNPRHVLASNAQYFIGMSYLQQKEYKIAEEEFSRVLINYPHSNAIPDALLALVKVSDHLQKPARVTYFKEKLNSHFAQSPQAKAVAGIHKSEKTEIQKPHAPEPPTAPVPEMEHTDGVEPSVVNQ